MRDPVTNELLNHFVGEWHLSGQFDVEKHSTAFKTSTFDVEISTIFIGRRKNVGMSVEKINVENNTMIVLLKQFSHSGSVREAGMASKMSNELKNVVYRPNKFRSKKYRSA